MKILVVGCGSAGSRHAGNAAALADVAVVDIDRERSRACSRRLGLRCFDDLDRGLAWRPDGVVVATPPSTHIAVAELACRAGAHVLVEKPIAHRTQGVRSFLDRSAKAGRRVHVVCNMRFHPAVQALRAHSGRIGRPILARAHFGSYLPDMRPGVDYRRLECADWKYGGIILDNVHEIDYLTWLFGPAVGVQAVAANSGELGIDGPDHAGIHLLHASGVRSEVHLDYLQRPKRRGCEIIGTEGCLLWSSEGKSPERCEVRLLRRGIADGHSILSLNGFDPGLPYVEVMDHFLRGVGGEVVPLATGHEALHVLEAALAACRAARNGKAVEVAQRDRRPVPEAKMAARARDRR